jgi:hypothetical protein
LNTLTKWFIWGAFLTIVAYDVWIATHHGLTISAALKQTNQEYPVLGFGWGVLSGHLFWPQKIRVSL